MKIFFFFFLIKSRVWEIHSFKIEAFRYLEIEIFNMYNLGCHTE